MSEQANRIEEYYEANTKRFLRFAQLPGSFAIHRALDLPSDYPEVGKFNRQYALIAKQFKALRGEAPKSVLDLGCGVGGGLAYLGQTFPQAMIKGVTISSTQARIANAMLGSSKLFPRAMAVDADFCRVDLNQKFDLICAVESAIHCSHSRDFFQAVKRHSHADTVLVIIDDFLADRAPRFPRKVDIFKKHWRVPGLDHVKDFCQPSHSYFELVSREDLTPYIELERPRDRVIAFFYPLMRLINIKRWPFLDNMVGGHCLQRSLRNGDIRYLCLSFRSLLSKGA